MIALALALVLGQAQEPHIPVEVGALITAAPCVDEPSLICDTAQLLGPSDILTRGAWEHLSSEHVRLQRENAGLQARVKVLEAAVGSPVLWVGLGVALGVGAALALPHVLR